MRWDAGVDLGTRNVRMVLEGDGSVLSQAAAVAVRGGEAVVCALDAAYALYGRECEGVEVCFPLADGTLKNSDHARALLQALHLRAQEKRPGRRMRMLITCAPFARPVQQDALLRAALDAGVAEAGLVRADAAMAVGAGLNVLEPTASLLVDVGAGKISATLFTRGLVAAYAHLPYGMARIDERLARLLRTQKGFLIGPRTAEEIKEAMGTAQRESVGGVEMPVAGLNMEKRVPQIFSLESEPVARACEDVVYEILGMVASVVDNAPEELAADLNDAGCVLAGGGALLAGLDKRLGDHLGIPCRVAESPQACAAMGLSKILEAPDAYEGLTLETMARTARH